MTGKYYAAVLVDDGRAPPDKPKQIDACQILGLDLGLTHLLIESNGHKQANPRFLVRATKNLRRKQRALSRKQKGTANQARARLLVAKYAGNVPA